MSFMVEKQDGRPRLGKRLLNSHILPGMVPVDLHLYVHPLVQCAVAELTRQKGRISLTGIELALVRLIQQYHIGFRKRKGPESSKRIRDKLKPLQDTLLRAMQQLLELDDTSRETLPNTASLTDGIRDALESIAAVCKDANKRGRPSERHIQTAVQVLAEIWEHSLERKFSKTLDFATDYKGGFGAVYVSPGPLFIQTVFRSLDPQVSLSSLDTAISKVNSTITPAVK